MTTNQDTCLDSLEEVKPDCICPLDVWVRMPPDERGVQYLRRKRYRTFREIYADMHKHLDKMDCEKCGHVRQRPQLHTNYQCPECYTPTTTNGGTT